LHELALPCSADISVPLQTFNITSSYDCCLAPPVLHAILGGFGPRNFTLTGAFLPQKLPSLSPVSLGV
jgi:hypothetical protein